MLMYSKQHYGVVFFAGHRRLNRKLTIPSTVLISGCIYPELVFKGVKNGITKHYS